MTSGQLGELELAIMDFIWTAGDPVRVSEVHSHLSKVRPIAYTTAMTVMSRLRKKGLLARSAKARAHAYRATLSREDYSADLLLGILRQMGDHRRVLRRFVERMPPRDAAMLGELVSGKRAGQ